MDVQSKVGILEFKIHINKGINVGVLTPVHSLPTIAWKDTEIKPIVFFFISTREKLLKYKPLSP